jgi:hypothetical protein
MALTLEGRDAELAAIVERAYQRSEPEHRTFRSKAEEFYRLYRGFTDFKENVSSYRDADQVISSAQEQWGAELFIPFVYSTVETIVPRMVSNGPRMIIVPRDEQAFGSVHAMKIVVDAQCKQINYETILQVIGKDGLIYGLGVGKTRWRYETRMQIKATPDPFDPALFREGPPEKVCTFDDAVAERVDPFDLPLGPAGRLDGQRRVHHPSAVARAGGRRPQRQERDLAQPGERPDLPVDTGGSARRPRAHAALSHLGRAPGRRGLQQQRDAPGRAARGVGVPRRPAGHHRAGRHLSGAGRPQPVGHGAHPVQIYRRRSSAGASWGSARSSRCATCSTRSTRSDPSAATPRRSR